MPRDAPREGGDALGAKGATTASTTASTSTTSSTPGQAPGVHEPQATDVRQLSRSSTRWWLAEVCGEDVEYCTLLRPGEGSVCFWSSDWSWCWLVGFLHWCWKSPRGGVDRRKLKFTTLNILQAGVSVRIKSESGREGKQINQENKADDTVICFTEVRF
jgi:hypothetical protein